jgi:hypothetical protein
MLYLCNSVTWWKKWLQIFIFYFALATPTRYTWGRRAEAKKSMTWATAVQIDQLPEGCLRSIFFTIVADATWISFEVNVTRLNLTFCNYMPPISLYIEFFVSFDRSLFNLCSTMQDAFSRFDMCLASNYQYVSFLIMAKQNMRLWKSLKNSSI